MRDFFKFIPFLWYSLSQEVVAVLVLIVCLGGIIVSTLIFGKFGFLIFIGFAIFAVVTTALVTFFVHLCVHVSGTWKEYKELREKEAQKIVDRLKGEGHTAAKTRDW